ncbi:MAG TPA: type II secretion system secretin GspD, partial [Gammaproteobacteria bacterium]|nr:type II secretion system secretin GspD [Gammaproteobacteria bacterium]
MKTPVKIGWLLLAWMVCTLPLHAETVTLNLKDADISALISTVAEVTERNFIVDPRVKGKVTVISTRPMNSDEVYQVFLSILKVHGFAAVPSGEVIKIVPDVNAKQDGIPTTNADEPGRGDEMVTRVVQVDNVTAAQLVPILRPLVPQQGHLAAYPATNVLIISDRANNVERLVSIIRRIDQVSDSEIEVIPLEHASAAEVVRVLTSLNRAAPGSQAGAAADGPILVADERTNSVLLGGDHSDRLRMRAIISHLDTPLDTGGNTDVIYLRYAEASEIVDTLMGVGKIEERETQQGKTTTTRGGVFDIQADEATNALVITAPPDIMRTLKRVISQLDIRRAQVLVEAVIAEVSADTTRELGVQWIFSGIKDGQGPVGVINFTNSGSPVADVINGAAAVADGGTFPSIIDNALLGFGRTDGSFNYVAVMNALASDANTNILSTPTLVTLDNEEAEIVIGENVPFVTGSFTSTGAADGATNPFQTIQREDVGLTLKIKPQINEGDALRLEIEQEVSSIADSVAGASDLVTNKRSIKTNVMVDNGQVVVLGGLIEENVRESQQKVPLLGDIPVLGALFRSNTGDVEKTNLMVFIHPVILRDAAVTNVYTNNKYNYIRSLQLGQDEDGVNLMPDKHHPSLPKMEDFSSIPVTPMEPAAAASDTETGPPAEA